ncbi:MAG: DNA-binding protein [Burkholderiales bacterium]|nr:DNA-binding protein [Burkholderiales bacterium]
MRCGNSSDCGATLVRLRPGEDLRHSLIRIAKQRRLKAAVILSGVGSLSQANLRFAGRPEGTKLAGPFEIVSITGTVSCDGLHVHLSIADAGGRTLGGHLMPGCKVHTTCELALMELAGWRMRRVFDAATGYRELRATRRRR